MLADHVSKQTFAMQMNGLRRNDVQFMFAVGIILFLPNLHLQKQRNHGIGVCRNNFD
jgi:hypothetical protein